MEQFHFAEEIGSGNHSTVYKARIKKTVEYVAIKSIDKGRKPKILNEVKIISRLDHKNVLSFHSWYETSNHLWQIVEYCTGGSLLQILKQDKRLPETAIRNFGMDIIRGLQFIHSKGILYCDLKPSNIMLDGAGVLKLSDFGYAINVGQTSCSTRDGLRGSPCYMAPELWSAAGCYSYASDLWSLGCVMYEMFNGTPPFVASSLTEVTELILTLDPELRQMGEEVQALVSGLLVKHPQARLKWPDVIQHPFWYERIPARSLPPEPHFDAMLTTIANDDPNTEDEPLTPSTPVLGVKAIDVLRRSVDIGRLTKNARSNMDSETVTEDLHAYDHRGAADSGGVTLGDADADFDFSVARPASVSRFDESDLGVLDTSAAGPAARPSSSGSAGSGSGKRRDRTASSGTGTSRGGSSSSGGSGSGRRRDSRLSSPASALPSTVFEAQRSASPAPASTPTGGRPRAEDPLALPSRLDGGQPGSIARPNPTKATTPRGSRRGGAGGAGKGDAGGADGGGQSGGPRGSDGPVPESTFDQVPTVVLDESNLVVAGEVSFDRNMLWHSSDVSVKPILNNKRIEKPVAIRFDASALKFKSVSADEALALMQREGAFEELLTNFVKAATPGPSSSSSDRINALRYFQSLCVNGECAETIINSTLTPMLVGMLKDEKSLSIQLELVLILGLLVRFATYISPSLLESNMASVLTEMLRERGGDVVLRRRLLSALGELVFYVAQETGGGFGGGGSGSGSGAGGAGGSGGDAEWSLPNYSLVQVVNCVEDDDEVVQHYAVKTIENVCTTNSEMAVTFVTKGVAASILRVYQECTSENLRVSAASALSRLGRKDPTVLVPLFPAGEGTRFVVSGLHQSSPKLKQAFLNMLFVVALEGSTRVVADLLSSPDVLSSLIANLSAQSAVVQGKSLACLCALSTTSRSILLAACGFKLLNFLDRLSRAEKAFTRDWADVASRAVVDAIPVVTAALTQKIEAFGSRRNPPAAEVKAVKQLCAEFRLTLHLLSSSSFRPRLLTEQFLRSIALYSVQLEVPFLDAAEFKDVVLAVVSGIAGDSEALLTYHEVILRHVLPAVIAGPLADGEANTRYSAVCALSTILSKYIHSEDLYHATSSEKKKTTHWINQLVVKHFLPATKRVLGDDGVITTACLQLLHSLVTANPVFVSVMADDRIGIVDYLEAAVAGPSSAVCEHHLWLLHAFITSGEVDLAVWASSSVPASLVSLATDAVGSGAESWLEPIFQTVGSLFTSINAAGSAGGPFSAALAALGAVVAVTIRCLRGMSREVGKAAGDCLVACLVSCGGPVHHLVVEASNLAVFREVLEDKRESAHLKEIVLRVLSWVICGQPGHEEPTTENHDAIITSIREDSALVAVVRECGSAKSNGAAIAGSACGILRALDL